VFVLVKSLEMLIMIFLMFKIKHVKEELNIRSELMWILGITIFFSMFYAIPLIKTPDTLIDNQ
jgi:predicted membrane-bound dolichyl-phosphate-mannose-protein mannosyltransferase